MRIAMLLLGLALGCGTTWLVLHGTSGVDPARAPAISSSTDDDEAGRAQERGGRRAIVLTAYERELAGITTAALAVENATREQATFGRVADTAEMLRQRRAIDGARAVQAAQAATLDAVRQRLERLRGFSRAGEVNGARELAELEIAWRREIERSRELEAGATALEDAFRARWGDGLRTLRERDPQAWPALERGAACLVEFALPQAASVANGGVMIGAENARARARPAAVVAPAPRVLAETARPTWFATTDCDGLRAGMRVPVWLGDGSAPLSGPLLPAAALVWLAGERWFYVETSAGVYERRRLAEAIPRGADFVLVDGTAAGARVVVRGAQALLAEENRARIPVEDDD